MTVQSPRSVTPRKLADAKRDLCLVACVRFDEACEDVSAGGAFDRAHAELVSACRAWARAEREAGRL